MNWHIAMRPGKRAALDLRSALAAKIEQVEKIKASIRAKVEHPFRLIKQQFGHAKVRYRGLAKNTARLQMMFALGNLWMVRKTILQGARA
ncbi:mobile element protein [Piscinibacter sakaiensis]|uniref:Mobile element protein n=1 Tax=Piscinibacter sakaiensis TaxID=1547922 RepID=A0A0K8P8T6_PISS1|nr:mobile element protein [Piscinibacter sakaiensis]